jgi:hypothetical protein
MNPNAITKVVVNLLISFAGGYGSAVLAGANSRTAIATGLVALAANGAGLVQQSPMKNNKTVELPIPKK